MAVGKIVAIAAAMSGAAPAVAGESLAVYFAELSARDMVSSGGARLGSFGAVLQQDRANFHRFGLRDAADEDDPFFADSAMRARIPELYARGTPFPPMEKVVLDGLPLEVIVFVCGTAGVPDYIAVDYADGDGHRGCD